MCGNNFAHTKRRIVEMANVVHGSDDASKTQWFKECADAALRDRCSVTQGKGSRWRTLPNELFRDNFDSIFRKPRKVAKRIHE
jgi:hypothetical protein